MPATGQIRRFTVMAILQAARGRALGLPEPAAYSWGLNRAIFYAAAKRGFRSPGEAGGGRGTGGGEPSGTRYELGDDFAYRAEGEAELRFTIGGEVQTPAAFDRQVARRFGNPENFRRAWEEAGRIVAECDRELLRSSGRFYSEVYRPRRDELSSRWEQEFGPAREAAGGAPTGAAPPSPTPRRRTGARTGRG